MNSIHKLLATTAIMGVIGAAPGCGNSSNRNQIQTPTPTPPAALTIEGEIHDGPVSGGSLYIFDATGIVAALGDAATAEDRAAALDAASPLVSLQRESESGPTYSIEVDGQHADKALFIVFDGADSNDASFGGESLDMLSMVISIAEGETGIANITPHTSLSTQQIVLALDPDGDGAVIDQAEIANVFDGALANTLTVFGRDTHGEEFFADSSPFSEDDGELLTASAEHLAIFLRGANSYSASNIHNVYSVLAADIADGELDGVLDESLELSESLRTLAGKLQSFADAAVQLPDQGLSPSCSASANELHKSCGYEVLDEAFIGAAKCADLGSEETAEECLAELDETRAEAFGECGDIHEARLAMCDELGDAIHDPQFGLNYAEQFVDPRNIGSTVTPNPYFPLVNGNEWVFEGSFEEDGETVTERITITVSDKIKMIDGIACLVVRDVVVIDGELIEDTDDWFAQDNDGNVWYCGEEVKDYETFDGDEPQVPELIAIDGSFKADRDGDEGGILLPADAQVGDVFRQEFSAANAEDAIEILAVNAEESVPAANCDGECLQTRDFSPLDPGVEEHKFYKPGIGKILEIDLESGDRVELIEFSQAQ